MKTHLEAKSRGHRRDTRAGYTLVELMMASAIGSATIAGVLTMSIQQRSYHEAHREKTEIRQNVTYAIDSVSHDIRMAGYGLDVPSIELSSWINWIPGFTSNPKINDGANGQPAKVFIAAAFDQPVAELVSGITTGDTAMTVCSLDGSALPLNVVQNRVLFLGKTETIRITNVSGSGTNATLSISRDPVAIQGVQFEYPAGTPIELVKVIEYERIAAGVSSTPYPYLTRRDTSVPTQFRGLWDVSAAYIDDFQVSQSSGEYLILVTGIASKRDKDYVDPIHSDHYRRLTATATVTRRN